uniref:Uncharacterized protein n=1 Tax=Tanacetum cinerariifolium TaxID=118510 RepID=A0A699GTN4_TANCI|nr:hypothetical protein [Tanacetum cinerariifolium]
MWKLRIEQYFQVQYYALWDVIENDNSFNLVPRTIANVDGTSTSIIPARFGGNDATKKTQKTLLKQMYENFNALSTKSPDFIFKRIQKIASQLAILDLNTISIDDLYNNFKIVEHKVKRTFTTSSSSGYQNMAFLSSPGSTNEVDTTNIQVSIVNTPVSTVSTHDNTANLSDATVGNGFEVAVSFAEHESIKVLPENWECKSLRNQESRPRNQDSSINTMNIEDTSSKSMVAIDGAGFDWSYMADDEAPTNMALMDFSDSEGNRVTSAIGKQGINDVKSSACWVWRHKIKVQDHISKNSGSYICKRFDYVDPEGKLKCSRHMTGNISYLTDFKGHDGGSKTINSIKQIHATVDGKAVVISESSVRSDLLFIDEDGITCLTNDEIFENLALMGYEQLVKNSQIQGKRQLNTASSKTINSIKQIHATVDGKAVVISESSVRSDLLFDDEDGITCLINDEIFENLALMGYEQLLTKLTFQKGGSTRRQETIGGTPAQTRSKRVLEHLNESPLPEVLSNRVTTLKNALSRTKAIYHKAFITLTKRVKKLETQLKKKRSRAVIHSSDEEEPSLDIEDSPKQGRMIGEIDKDKNFNLVSEQGEVHEIAEPLKYDDDATLAKTLLNIKRSTTKDKEKLHGEELAKETTRQEQEKYNLKKALELQKQLDQKEEDVDKGDQTQDIDWNDPEGMGSNSYFFLKDFEIKKEVMKRFGFNLQQEISKKQKIDEQIEEEVEAQAVIDEEVKEMKHYMKIVPDEEIAIDAIPLATKPLVIVEYNIVKEGKINLETLLKLVKDIHRNTRPEDHYERVLWGDIKVMFEPDIEMLSEKIEENRLSHYEQGEVHETIEPLKDDDDATLAETLLNIKRSTAKDKGKAQKLHAKELAKETARQEQEKYNLKKALELQKQLDQREEDVDKEIWINLQQEISKKQKLDEQTEDEVEAQADTDQEVEEMKLYMKIVPDEEIAIDAIPLATKPPVIVEYKIVKEGKINTYHIIRADVSTKRYTSMINLLKNINREDLKTLWKIVKDKHGNTRPEEDY